ncbi:hypothetical protein Tco_0148392, partial [Tanacetum coccineum]
MLHPPLLKGALSRCSIPHSCLQITQEKMRVISFEEIFSLPSVFRTSSGIPSYLDNRNSTFLELLHFAVHDFYWFLNKVQFVIVKLDLFKRDNVTPSNLSMQRNVEYPKALHYGSIAQ